MITAHLAPLLLILALLPPLYLASKGPAVPPAGSVSSPSPNSGSNYGDVHESGHRFREHVREVQHPPGGGSSPPGSPPPPSGNGSGSGGQQGFAQPDPVKDAPMEESDDMFYFFSLHDYNHDAHLDGHELRNAFTEYEVKMDESRNGAPDENGRYAKDRLKLRDVESMIENVLREDDTDNDGMISW
ncbi:hypothetical protein HK101_009925 [Irineochytrium annulatum]|nr:hypothetical protein HK101_009925 [Irineochytrium annulatum]